MKPCLISKECIIQDIFFIHVDELLKPTTEDHSLFGILFLEFMNDTNFVRKELLLFNCSVG